MAVSLLPLSFTFPPLKLKKIDLDPDNYSRLCFQFLVKANKECILIGYKMDTNRACIIGSPLLILQKDNDSDKQAVRLTTRVLFVQLELSRSELTMPLNTPDTHLRFTPIKQPIEQYRYVIYRLDTLGLEDVTTSPCPPAVPPDGNSGGEG